MSWRLTIPTVCRTLRGSQIPTLTRQPALIQRRVNVHDFRLKLRANVLQVLFLAGLGLFLTAVAPSASAQYLYNRADFAIAPGGGGDLAIGDFNGDGIPDLAVASVSCGGGCPGTLSILLGQPGGTFTLRGTYAQSGVPFRVVVGDFNNDGKLDLAVLNGGLGNEAGSAFVATMLGHGDGTFSRATTTSLGSNDPSTDCMVAGDFNGDGRLDLAATFAGGQIEVLPGNGDGSFDTPISAQVPTDTSNQILYLATGDFNGDGKLDAAVALPSSSGPSVAVLIGNGNGSFQAPVIYPMTGNQDIVAVDVNHDGILDLVGDGGALSVLLGKGDGTFQGEDVTPMSIISLVVGDFNGDGNPDVGGVASYNSFIGMQFQVYIGDGKGGFYDVPINTPLPYDSTVIRLGDFNGDGVLDIATPQSLDLSSTAPPRVSILLGNGDGTLGASRPVTDISYPQAVAVADFNGDGKPDLAIGESDRTDLAIRMGNGDGTFSSGDSVPLDGSPVLVVSGDFNGDGKAGLAALLGPTCNCIRILMGNGDGTFTQGSKLPAMLNDDVLVAADFNGDGKLDLMVGGVSPTRLLFGNGDGTFQSPVGSINWANGGGPIAPLLAADFNHDGKMDAAGTTSAFTLEVFLGNGSGKFQPPISYPIPGASSGGLTAADFNGDGKLDIAVAAGMEIDVFLGNGDGTFQSPGRYQLTFGADGQVDWIVAGDFNGDGKIDLAAGGGNGDGVLYVFLGNGDGTFSTPVDFHAPPELWAGAAADFNLDGVTDLALASVPGSVSQTSSFSVWTSAPLVSLWPRSLDFGNEAVGSSSAPQTITLWNVGTAPLQIASLAASGDFSQTNDCGSRVPVHGKCAVNVTFTPTAGGARTAALVLKDNARTSELAVPLMGTGTGVFAIASPASIAFGSVLMGTTSSSQTVTLTNSGAAGLSISAITASGPFAVVASGTTCAAPGAVAAGASCVVAISFTPKSAGQTSGSLSFSDTDASSPQIVSLSGTGLDFSIAAASGSPTTATVAPGQSTTYNLSLAATPGFSASVSLTCAGAPSEAVCSVSPGTVTTSESSATAVSVSVSTTAPGMTAPHKVLRPPPPAPSAPLIWWSVLMASLGGTMLGLRARPRSIPSMRMALTTALLFAVSVATISMVGCGGGGSTGPPPPQSGTPPGTYSLTVTGTLTSGSNTLTHSMTLTLTVS